MMDLDDEEYKATRKLNGLDNDDIEVGGEDNENRRTNKE